MTQTTPSTSAQGPVAAVAKIIDPGAFAEENHPYWMGPVRSETRVNSAMHRAREIVDLLAAPPPPSPAASPASPSGVEFVEAGKQWRMKDTVTGHWSDWRDGPANFSDKITKDWSVEERIVYARASLASDATPAASEDVVLTAGDDHLLNKALDASTTHAYDLAKPASEPAGGVREARARAIYEAMGFAYDGRTVGTNGPYGEWATAIKAADAIAALSSPAGEPIGYMRAKDNDGNSFWCSRQKSAYYTEALYAHPAPATVEIPDDLVSHRTAWRSALVLARDSAPPAREDFDDRAYWQHELDVFDRVYAALAPATEGRKS